MNFLILTFLFGIFTINTIASNADFYDYSLPSASYTIRSPISITSESEFDSDHGVTSGSGTWDDPYIIDNWEITTSGSGIYIAYTQSYVVIKNCKLYGNLAIDIRFASNIIIQNCSSIIGNNVGIVFYYAINITIKDCYVYGWDYGISIDYTSQVVIDNCDAESWKTAISLYFSSYVNITNTITSSDYTLISSKSSYVYFYNVTVIGSNYGVYIHDTSYVIVDKSIISGVNYAILIGTSGIFGSNLNITILNSTLYGANYGVYQYSSLSTDYLNIIDCSFINCGLSISMSPLNYFLIDNNLMDGGGIVFANTNYGNLSNNIINNVSDGISISSSSYINMINNSLYGNNAITSNTCLRIFSSNYLNITQNSFRDLYLGLNFSYVTDFLFYENMVINTSLLFNFDDTNSGILYNNTFIGYNSYVVYSNDAIYFYKYDEVYPFGNYWYDYIKKYPSASPNSTNPIVWDTPYQVDAKYDMYPLIRTSLNEDPTISNPDDFIYYGGDSYIEWTVIDLKGFYNQSYVVYLNGSLYKSGSWKSGVSIRINFNLNVLGLYNFTIYIEDGMGGFTNDTVLMEYVNEAPIVNDPSDIDIYYGNYAFISWNIIDFSYNDSRSYIITKNAYPIRSGVWENNDTITYTISEFLGSYVFNITFYDGFGLSASSSVNVIVRNGVPILSQPLDFTKISGDTYPLVWAVSDLSIGVATYSILRNGSIVKSGSWYNIDYIRYVSPALEEGIYNFTINVDDGYGGFASDTVFVTYLPNDDPIINALNSSIIIDPQMVHLSWNVTDKTIKNALYAILRNGTIIMTGEWGDGDVITYSFNAIQYGVVNITLIVYDGYQKEARSTILVTVQSPIIPEPEDYTWISIVISSAGGAGIGFGIYYLLKGKFGISIKSVPKRLVKCPNGKMINGKCFPE